MKKKAFSLIELSIVILIIGIIITGLTQGSRLLGAMRLSTARTVTQSSPVLSIKDLTMWLETTSKNSFAIGSSGSYSNIDEPEIGDSVGRWNDLNIQSTSKNHAIQATSSKQPTYQNDAINKLPALYLHAPHIKECLARQISTTPQTPISQFL